MRRERERERKDGRVGEEEEEESYLMGSGKEEVRRADSTQR